MSVASAANARCFASSVFLALLTGTAWAATAPAPAPSELVILSTSDVKGETNPCGCHVPKGGLPRRASFVDSVRALAPQVLLVDAGGYFADSPERKSVAAFQLDGMKKMGTAAVAVGARDLAYGVDFLREQARVAGAPVVCANLFQNTTGKPAFEPWRLERVGKVTVGVFALFHPRSDLGPSAEGLRVADPTATAVKTAALLRSKGATVIVLLSQLGLEESQALASAVPGIDVVIAARSSPMVEDGRPIGKDMVLSGGQNGWYIGVTHATLDARGRMTAVVGKSIALGPEVRDEPAMMGRVKVFEDALLEGTGTGTSVGTKNCRWPATPARP